ANAKQRLAHLLTAAERAGLVRAMVEDVLAALDACSGLDETVVVTRDADVETLARAWHARILPEPDVSGLIPAATAARRVLSGEGVGALLFVPGDIPLIDVDELNVVLNGLGMSDGPEFVIVPARDLGGSNCVVCSPPDCMTFGFGEDSFRRHLGIARELGIEPMVTRLPGIGLDVDTPDDLLALNKELEDRNADTRTRRFLRDSGIAARLDAGLQRIG
ncbi:MAG: 2-phospho-L-lactate guanylyltransferase, partial [Pseudomonadales bacterium]|nr:2-phospho-L-lactate guanylyltransferase [Pseudomonadales bacterium]